MWSVAPSQSIHVPRYVCTVKSMGQSRQCAYGDNLQAMQSVSPQAQTNEQADQERPAQQGADRRPQRLIYNQASKIEGIMTL